ncbi:MAG TPA: PQQ-binding-like beta-propeller repeat protein [Rhizomicrobium sp.]|jgi:PQQ-dependent dehydrogenase (methanol/ethanol family)|nr:PQQ-binding-like beta-propeller repeat protein [Rhizomicrobium sp.]
MKMTRSRAWLRTAASAALCVGAALVWTGQASGQGEESRPAPVRGPPPASVQIQPITANVTNSDAERINADADQDNWRLHGRTYDNQRFSPLSQINAGNVKQLKPVALIQTGVLNSMESTPLEIDGVLYVEAAGNVVQAYDATTGEELWSYTPVLDYSDLCCGPQARGVAVADGKVFVAQVDGHVVALDARTGQLIWKTINSELLPQPTHWYTFTGAPQVYGGLVMVGNGGAEWPTRGFYAAVDENTGKLVWRFWDTAGPDDPNFKGAWEGDSWKIGGGSIWDAAAIDTKQDLAVFAVGNPNPDLYGGNRKGTNIYTASIVAVHAKTGKVAWYYQEVPHDVWDWDSSQGVMLFDTVDAHGKSVPAAAEANKDGIVYIVNRTNGKLIRHSDPFVLQSETVVNRVQPDETARVYYPGNHGGVMWQPAAFSPITHYYYTMGINESHIYKAQPSTPWVPGTAEVGQQFGSAPTTPAERAALASQMIPQSGNISAIDVNTGKIAWQYPSDHMMYGGVLATASNLIFAGEVRGNFMAFDAKTGTKLWSYHLGAGVCSPPITYRVKGVQYIAVGASGCHEEESAMKREGRPIFGDSLAIFALPGGSG